MGLTGGLGLVDGSREGRSSYRKSDSFNHPRCGEIGVDVDAQRIARTDSEEEEWNPTVKETLQVIWKYSPTLEEGRPKKRS